MNFLQILKHKVIYACEIVFASINLEFFGGAGGAQGILRIISNCTQPIRADPVKYLGL